MSSVIQRALSGGELDPILWARADVTKYMTGLRTLRNFFIRRNGGVQTKPGSTKIQNTKSNAKVRLIPFIYSQSVTYMMEFGNNYIRFYQNGLPVPPTAFGAVAAYNNATAYKYGDMVTSGGNTYINTLPPIGVANTLFDQGAGNFANPLLYGGAFSTVTGTAPPAAPWSALPINTVYEIGTTWSSADLPNLKFDQTGKDMVITVSTNKQWRLSLMANGFSLFDATSRSYMQWAIPTNDQGDSNVKTVAAAKVVYAVAAVSAAGDEFPEFVNADGTTAVIAHKQVTTTDTVSTSGAPVQINWTVVPNAVNYNIYSMNKKTGVFGFIGSTNLLTFQDNGITPDFTNPWVQRAYTYPGGTSNDDPSCCAFYQQRLFYGNTVNNPSTVYGSQTGLYDNFNVNVPTIASDSLSFKMAGAQDIIQHLLSLGTLLVFTYGSINSVNGDASGAIAPDAINPHRESIHGASSLRPLIVGEFALYAQAQGSIIRDLGFNFQVDGYKGDDLTVFATHLFDNYTIVDWTYQQTPHSVVWAVRSDGTLLSLTYLREQQVMGWAHHDTLGTYENVCAIPEGSQTSVYVVTNRVINGSTVRFVERFYSQQYSPTLQLTPVLANAPNYYSDYRDFIGMDCATTVDGRSNSADSMTVSGGTNWNETELLTLTLGSNFQLTFTAGMATNQDMIFLYDSSGNLYRFKITVFSSGTVVQGFLDRTLAAGLRSVATSKWSYARSVITGLSYLEGQKVSVWGDGNVVASPNNAAYPVLTVTSGSITLDKPYAVIQIGLPFISDIETLDIDTPGPQDNMASRFKIVGEVTVYMVNSRSVWVGGISPDLDSTNTSHDPLYRLTEQKLRQNETYDSPMALQTGKINQTIQPDWDDNGHVFIRNVDPAPVLVSAISPEGFFPGRVG